MSLPERLADVLKTHLDEVRSLHREDLERGLDDVYLPGELAKKYPNAGKVRSLIPSPFLIKMWFQSMGYFFYFKLFDFFSGIGEYIFQNFFRMLP